jgi:hypothetical protein
LCKLRDTQILIPTEKMSWTAHTKTEREITTEAEQWVESILLNNYQKDPDVFLSSLLKADASLSPLGPSPEVSVPGKRFIHLFNDFAKMNRTLFTTSTPLEVANIDLKAPVTMGTYSDIVEIGDSVYLIAGVPMPLVMRETDEKGSYKLINAALLIHSMKGEFWNSKWKEEDLEEFTII